MLALLTCTVLAFGFSGCLEDGSSTTKLTKKRDDYISHRDYQAERLKEAQQKEKELSADLAIAKEISDSIANMFKNKRAFTVEIDEIEARLESSIALLDSYRKLGEHQGTAIVSGEVLGNVTLKNGVILKNATVTQLRGDAIGLKHSSGVGFYSIGDLPAELRKQFLRPPDSSLVASKVDPRAVLLRKPNSLKSPEAASADRSAQMRAEFEQSAEERRLAVEENEAESKARREEYEKKNQLRKENYAKASAMRGQITAHKSVISSLKNSLSDRQHTMNYGNTRTSAVDQRKIIAGYEQKIASHNQAIAVIYAEIAKLEAQY